MFFNQTKKKRLKLVLPLGLAFLLGSCANLADALGTDATGLGTVKDANGIKLGAAQQVAVDTISVLNEEGYLYEIGWNGSINTFMYFIANDCTGQGILSTNNANNARSAYEVTGTTYLADNIVNGLPTIQAGLSAASFWNNSQNNCIVGPQTISGFTVSEITRASVGIPDSITGPLTVE